MVKRRTCGTALRLWGDDPELAVAPAVIERALVHNLSGATTGSLQNNFWTSKEMRSFASKSGGEAGIAFNEEVARVLSAMGLTAHPSALPSQWLNIKKTEEVERLGDIDVLAVSRDGSVVWVIEAKDLKLCRTIGETCRRLGEYRGVTDAKGRPDSLLKHLRRVAYLRENAPKLVATLKLPATPKVCGLIVVNAVQPMNQLPGEYQSDSQVASMESLESIRWETGWS